MRTGQTGFTLIELMIVVAIIGVLAGLAVYLYQGQTRKAKASEVHAIFAEFKIRQEQYHSENGTYLSSGADESDVYPPTPDGDTGTPIDPATWPAQWTALRMQPDKNRLYCSYVSIAGPANDGSNIGGIASGQFNMTTAPLTNWYYILAECDFDGNPGLNSLYMARSDVSGVATLNPGH